MPKPLPNTQVRVLVVDDDSAFAETLADGLASLGWQARAIGSAQSALPIIQGCEFDALVTDLRMPGVDGLTLLAAAKQFAPQRPVIMMTAFSALSAAGECVRRGAYHCLSKPFKVAELDQWLQRALASRCDSKTV